MNKVAVSIAVLIGITLIFNIPTAEARRKKTVTKRLLELQSAAVTSNSRLADVAVSAEASLQKLDELILRIEEQGFTANTIVEEILQVRALLAPLVPSNNVDNLQNPFQLIQDVQTQFRSPDIDFDLRDLIDGEDFKEALRRLKKRRDDERDGGLLAQAGDVKGDLVDTIVNAGSLRIGANLEIADESEDAIRERLGVIPDALFVPLVPIAHIVEELSNGLTDALTLYTDIKETRVDGVSPLHADFINDNGPICNATDRQANRIFRTSLKLKALTLVLKSKAKAFQARIPRPEVQAGIHGYTGTSLVVTQPISRAAGDAVDTLEATQGWMDILASAIARKDKFCSDGPDPIMTSLENHRRFVEGANYIE
jgi:hypothetical protein